MNTHTFRLAAITLFLATSINHPRVLGQVPEVVPGDENYSLTLAFHKPDTILVVTPDSYSLSPADISDIERYVFWEQYQKKPLYIYKQESDLTAADCLTHLQLYGPFNQFKHPDFQQIPLESHPEGFMYGQQLFNQAADAFFYINDEATRLYTCRNSPMAGNHYMSIGAGYYQLYVFRGDELMFSANSPDQEAEESWNNYQLLRDAYFTPCSTRYFDFEIASGLNVDSIAGLLHSDADRFLDSLCLFLQVDTKGLEGIKTYIYDSREALQKFIAASPLFTVYGKSIGAINHLSAFDMALFRHETSHTVIGRKVGQSSDIFFLEGFAVCAEYFFDDLAYKKDLAQVKAHPERLTYQLIKSSHNFYDLIDNYPLAGAFTKFLIDKIGIAEFENIYASGRMEESLQEISGKNMEQLISEFKDFAAAL